MFRYSLSTLLLLTSISASAEPLTTDLSELQPLVGTWDCAGQNSPTPQSSAFEFESQFHIKAVLGGNFIQVTYSEMENSALPVARNNIEYWQGASGAFTSTFFNSFGQKGQLTAKGFVDGKLVWSGLVDTPNGPAPFEGRITLFQKDRLSVEPTLFLPDGTRFVIAELDCTKAG